MGNKRIVKVWMQRIIGLGLILMSILVTYLNYIPEIESYDGTTMLFIVPLGVYMFISNKNLIS